MSSKVVISKIEKLIKDGNKEIRQVLDKMINFLNQKYESTTGQIYFKTDLLNQELVKLDNTVKGLGMATVEGFKALTAEINILNSKIDILLPKAEKVKMVKQE